MGIDAAQSVSSRSTSHAVRNIQFVDSTGVSVSTFDNVASTLTVGTDLNVNAHKGPLQLGGGGSVYHYSSDASNLSGNLSAHAMVWSARANATWKFSPKADAQTVRVLSRAVRDGGRLAARVGVDEHGRRATRSGAIRGTSRCACPIRSSCRSSATARRTAPSSNTASASSDRARCSSTITRNFGQALKLQPKQQDPDAQAQTGPPPA